MNPKRILLITYIIAITIIASVDLKQGMLPKPIRFLGATTVWAVLSIMGEFGADLLAVGFGVGFTIALVYKYYLHTLGSSGTDKNIDTSTGNQVFSQPFGPGITQATTGRQVATP